MLGGYILLLLNEYYRYKIQPTPINITIGLFLLSFGISTFIGVDWYRSLWDSHERMLGLFTLSHYILYYLIITSVVQNKKDWTWLFRIFLLAGAIVISIAFLQKLYPDLLFNNKYDRVISTLGHPIYVGEYSAFLAFLGLLLFQYEKSRRWKIYALTGIALGITGIFLCNSRGPFLGFASGITVLIICYIITLRKYKKLRVALTCLVLSGVIFSCILYHNRQTEFVSSIPSIGRLLNTPLVDSANTRYMAWSIALDGWQDYPIFGAGPSNFNFIFNKYYNPKFLRYGYLETWFDNAHNVIVNTLAVQGLIGLILYLGLFGVPIFVLWKGYRKKIINQYTACFGTAFLANHFIAHLFVFENPTSYLYFFLFLAFINREASIKNMQPFIKKETEKKSSFIIPIITASLIFFLIYLTNFNPAMADKQISVSIERFYRSGDIEQLNEDINSISSPHIDDLRAIFVHSASQAILSLIQKGRVEKAKQLFVFSYSMLEKNKRLHPFDIRIHIMQSELLLKQIELTKNSLLLIKAEHILEEALEISPKRQEIQYMLSHVKLMEGKEEEAQSHLGLSLPTR